MREEVSDYWFYFRQNICTTMKGKKQLQYSSAHWFGNVYVCMREEVSGYWFYFRQNICTTMEGKKATTRVRTGLAMSTYSMCEEVSEYWFYFRQNICTTLEGKKATTCTRVRTGLAMSIDM